MLPALPCGRSGQDPKIDSGPARTSKSTPITFEWGFCLTREAGGENHLQERRPQETDVSGARGFCVTQEGRTYLTAWR